MPKTSRFTPDPDPIPPDFGLVDKVGLAKFLSVSPRTVEDYVQQKKIPHLRLGWRTVRFRISDVMKALDRCSVKEVS
jgi:excisionase family DNA binding protein